MRLIDGNYESGNICVRYCEGQTNQNDRQYTRVGKIFYEVDVDPEVIKILNRCEEQRFRIRITYGDRTTGRSWLEEHSIMGTIGRSMGPMVSPLLIERDNSMGGGLISPSNIIRIQNRSGQDLYRHPLFHVPPMEIRKREPSEIEYANTRWGKRELTHEVLVDGEVHAAFHDAVRAKKWIEFMQGKRQRSW
jgi:hypothetical protein